MVRMLLVSLLLTASAGAAPPAVTTLNPAGGERGSSVAVVATGTFDTWPVRVWSSSPGIALKAEKVKGQLLSVAIAKDAPLGAHWLRFHDDTGASALRPFIVGELPEVAEVEPNDDPKTAPIIALPTVVNGLLGKGGDVDGFRVKLAKGQTLVASLEANRTLRSPMDAILQLVSDAGAVVAQNHDTRGLDPELAFAAPTDGTYAVRLFAFPSQPDSSIRHFGSPACVYRLTLTTGEFVDFATPFAVERDRDATLTLQGWNLKEPMAKLGKSEDCYGSGNPFAILREPHPCFDGATDKPLTPPFSVTGRVDKAGSPSVIRIAGSAGKPLTIHVDPAGLSLTPVLRVADAADKQLLKSEPAALNGPIDVTFTPPATAVYQFQIRDLFGGAGPRRAYRLKVLPALPDAEATVASDRFVVAVGTPLEIPIAVIRKHGFTGELNAFADDLPEGVTVESKAVEANKLVLKLKATKLFAGGPIRIGIAKTGDADFRRPVGTARTETELPTQNLWLTVTPPAAKK